MVVSVYVADIIDVCALGAGLAVGGAVPMAGKTVETGDKGATAVVNGHLRLEDMGTAVELEDIVGGEAWSENVGG